MSAGKKRKKIKKSTQDHFNHTVFDINLLFGYLNKNNKNVYKTRVHPQ